ncbi:TadE/TadG family type IV pilus assembly protein [Alteraurantiacibacter palmitatis]|uniref:TadE family protein n=1 Tax=Alteraurantiacibacter palmitatis TaxID=2054628 RepID=A0ABV7E8Z0_9SPHN
MFKRFLSCLRKDQRGVAAVEFALWTTLFFFAVMVALDFGSYYMHRGKLSTAVGAAAVSAYNQPNNVAFNSMQGYVRSLSGFADATVTNSCNGVAGSCTNLNRTCACLKNDGTFVAAACNTSCSGSGVTAGSRAGYYYTITASAPFSPMIIPDSVLDGSTMSQRATVRLN